MLCAFTVVVSMMLLFPNTTRSTPAPQPHEQGVNGTDESIKWPLGNGAYPPLGPSIKVVNDENDRARGEYEHARSVIWSIANRAESLSKRYEAERAHVNRRHTSMVMACLVVPVFILGIMVHHEHNKIMEGKMPIVSRHGRLFMWSFSISVALIPFICLALMSTFSIVRRDAEFHVTASRLEDIHDNWRAWKAVSDSSMYTNKLGEKDLHMSWERWEQHRRTQKSAIAEAHRERRRISRMYRMAVKRAPTLSGDQNTNVFVVFRGTQPYEECRSGEIVWQPYEPSPP